MNQSGLAVMVGVSTATVTDWRHGRIQPRDENCKRLAQVLQVPITDVYAALGRIPEDAETPERIRELTELASRLSPEDQELAVALLRQLVDRLQSRGGTDSGGTELEGQSA